MAGQIITFYSHKGGVGRSMALANIAWIIASNGHRVLIIDWHIDAPGLHRYFSPFLADPSLADSSGLMDLVTEYASQAPLLARSKAPWPMPDILSYASPIDWEFPGDGGIDILPAGRSGPSYSIAVSAFNWTHFYERLNGKAFLSSAAERMRAEYDYVLIDSQPGIGEVSAICTVEMPDLLVVCCGLSHQNITGASAIARSVAAQRRGTNYPIFPVLMRVDWSEKELLEAARQEAAREFDSVIGHIPDRTQYWGEVEFPYTAYYSYVEILCPFVEDSRSSYSLLGSAERLCARITGGKVTRTKTLTESERRRGSRAFLADARYSDIR